MEGYRGIAIAQKTISETEYKHYCKQKQQYEMIIEKNLEFLGLIGLDETIQKGVLSTISQIKSKKINIWLTTGDSLNSALNAALNSGIRDKREVPFILKGIRNTLEMQSKLNEFNDLKKTFLACDDETLNFCLENHKKFFFEVSLKAQVVVLSRCTPQMKRVFLK